MQFECMVRGVEDELMSAISSMNQSVDWRSADEYNECIDCPQTANNAKDVDHRGRRLVRCYDQAKFVHCSTVRHSDLSRCYPAPIPEIVVLSKVWVKDCSVGSEMTRSESEWQITSHLLGFRCSPSLLPSSATGRTQAAATVSLWPASA